MKLFAKENDPADATLLAEKIAEVGFRLVSRLRDEIRQRQPAGLTLSQFRALAYIAHHAGVSLSQVAEHQGLSMPSMSKVVQDLVVAGYVTREYVPGNRRALMITVTSRGAEIFDHLRREALAGLQTVLVELPAEERLMIEQSILTLEHVLAQLPNAHCAQERREAS